MVIRDTEACLKLEQQNALVNNKIQFKICILFHTIDVCAWIFKLKKNATDYIALYYYECRYT